MKTFTEIKTDLNDIQYYSEHKERFDQAAKLIGPNKVIDIFEEYNTAIQFASAKFYELYAKIYVDGRTYESAAEELGYSVNYIYKSNKKLLNFFFHFFNQTMD